MQTLNQYFTFEPTSLGMPKPAPPEQLPIIETNLARLVDKWEEIDYSQLFANESSSLILNMSNYYSPETHIDQINEATTALEEGRISGRAILEF